MAGNRAKISELDRCEGIYEPAQRSCYVVFERSDLRLILGHATGGTTSGKFELGGDLKGGLGGENKQVKKRKVFNRGWFRG